MTAASVASARRAYLLFATSDPHLGDIERRPAHVFSIRGEIDVPKNSDPLTDVLSGLRPVPVRGGDLLPIGPPPARFPSVDVAPTPSITRDTLELLRSVPGPATTGWPTRPTYPADLGGLGGR